MRLSASLDPRLVFVDNVHEMLEMMCRLPCCFGDRVPFPEDKVLKLATEETRVENLVDLIFFSGRELDWWCRRRESTGDFRYMVRFKKGDMKYIMNAELGW